MNFKNKYLVIIGGIIFAGILAVSSFILGVYYIQQQQGTKNNQSTDNLQVDYTYNITPTGQTRATATPISCPSAVPTAKPTPQAPKYKTFIDKTIGIKFIYPASYGLKVSRRGGDYKPNSKDYRAVNWLGGVL